METNLLDFAEASGFEGGITLGKKLLSLTNRPDAVVSATSPVAAGIATAARQMGLIVPFDVRIAALSDSEIARSFVPPITALDLQPEAIGRACVDLLCKVIAGEQVTPYVTRSVLRPRGSTA